MYAKHSDLHLVRGLQMIAMMAIIYFSLKCFGLEQT